MKSKVLNCGFVPFAIPIISCLVFPVATHAEQRTIDDITNAPFTIKTEKQVVDTIDVPYKETIVCYQRYGLFGRKCCRIVKEVTRYRSESKAKSVFEVRQMPSLKKDPFAGSARAPEVELQGVAALAASTELIGAILRSQYKDWKLYPSEFTDEYVRIRSEKPNNKVSIEVTVELAITGPRSIVVDVTAAIDGDKAAAELEAPDLLEKLIATLAPDQ